LSTMKETIKRVSIDLFYKQGYFATGMNDIARASGIQKASIYYHYANKEDILFDIFSGTMRDLDENLEQALRHEENPEERLRSAVKSHVIFHMHRQKEVLISDSELRGLTVDNYRTIINLRDHYQKKFEDIIKEGIDKGLFCDNDYKMASYAVLTMCTAVSTWFRKSGRLPKESIAEKYTELIVNGLKRQGDVCPTDRHQARKGGGKNKD